MRSLDPSSLLRAPAGMRFSAVMADALADGMERDGLEVLGLWQVANRCAEHLRIGDIPFLRDRTLGVAADLMRRRIEPGDYDATGFRPWLGSVEERMARIDAAWATLGRTPDIVDPICWFAERAA